MLGETFSVHQMTSKIQYKTSISRRCEKGALSKSSEAKTKLEGRPAPNLPRKKKRRRGTQSSHGQVLEKAGSLPLGQHQKIEKLDRSKKRRGTARRIEGRREITCRKYKEPHKRGAGRGGMRQKWTEGRGRVQKPAQLKPTNARGIRT